MNQWKYLAPRPSSSSRQLYVMGRRLKASDVWSSMIANGMTLEETAEDWNLPLDAMDEIIRYCEENRALLDMEADEERRYLDEAGINLDPEKNPHRPR